MLQKISVSSKWCYFSIFQTMGKKKLDSHFTMIFEESCDSGDWSNIKIENNYFKL